jgi:hypothetical protein
VRHRNPQRPFLSSSRPAGGNNQVSIKEKPGITRLLVEVNNERPGFLTATNLNRGTCGEKTDLNPPQSNDLQCVDQIKLLEITQAIFCCAR